MGAQGAQPSAIRPLRTCIGCRRRLQQRWLTRVARVDDAIVVDTERRLPGRGAYLCGRASCATEVLTDIGRLARALRANAHEVTVDVAALRQDHRSDQQARHGGRTDEAADTGTGAG